MSSVFVIVEYHCHSENGEASVWVVVDPYDGEEDEPHYRSHGIKIVGPVPILTAELLGQNLEKVFNALGVDVTLEQSADD